MNARKPSFLFLVQECFILSAVMLLYLFFVTSARVKSYQIVKNRIGRLCAWKMFSFGITLTFEKRNFSFFGAVPLGKVPFW